MHIFNLLATGGKFLGISRNMHLFFAEKVWKMSQNVHFFNFARHKRKMFGNVAKYAPFCGRKILENVAKRALLFFCRNRQKKNNRYVAYILLKADN